MNGAKMKLSNETIEILETLGKAVRQLKDIMWKNRYDLMPEYIEMIKEAVKAINDVGSMMILVETTEYIPFKTINNLKKDIVKSNVEGVMAALTYITHFTAFIDNLVKLNSDRLKPHEKAIITRIKQKVVDLGTFLTDKGLMEGNLLWHKLDDYVTFNEKQERKDQEDILKLVKLLMEEGITQFEIKDNRVVVPFKEVNPMEISDLAIIHYNIYVKFDVKEETVEFYVKNDVRFRHGMSKLRF